MPAIADLRSRPQRLLHPRRIGPVALATHGRDGPAAFVTAQQLAERLGTTVVVITAVEPVPLYGAACEAAPLTLEMDEERRVDALERVRAAMDEAVGPAVDWPVEARFGAPAAVIARAAREQGARMIVMVSGRHHLVDRLFAGEETLQVMRRADRPVLAVEEGAAGTGLPRVAVVGVDFSPTSVRAAQSALSLLDDGGTLHLVNVWRPQANLSRQSLAAQLEERARLPELFERVLDALDVPEGVTVTRNYLEGHAVDELLRFARETGAGLIAAGRHSRPWYQRLLVGSTAARLVHGAPCSVLLEPEPDFAIYDLLHRHLMGERSCEVPEQWEAQLASFARRNDGRRTRLELDDPRLGAHAQETGYTLLGAAYDHRDGRVGLMLGAPDGGAHFTRMIDGVTSVRVLADELERDTALRITHGTGETVLTFLGDGGSGAEAARGA